MGIRKVQNEIGRRLKQLRLSNNYTQEYVASEINISRDHLSNLENGKFPVNIKTLFKLSEFYRVELKYFFE